MYQELEIFIKDAKDGNVKATENLLEKLYPLIVASIKRYYYRIEDFDDLLQEGRLVVLECLHSYDSTKGTYFLGYVKHMLRYYYLDKHKGKYMLSLNQKIGDEEDEELIDLLESNDDDPLEIFVHHEENQSLYLALDELTIKQRSIVIDFYYEGLAISQIAEKYEISYRTVVNTKTVALNKLKKLLG